MQQEALIQESIRGKTTASFSQGSALQPTLGYESRGLSAR